MSPKAHNSRTSHTHRSRSRARGLLKAIRKNSRMSPAAKRKAVATIRRKYPGL